MGWTLEEDGLDFYALMSLALWQASILGCKGYLCLQEGKTTIFKMVSLYQGLQLPFPKEPTGLHGASWGEAAWHGVMQESIIRGLVEGYGGRSVSMVTSSKHWKEICSYTILKICLAAHWNCLGWSASGSRRTRVSPCILPAVEEQQQRFAMGHPLNLDLNRSHWYCKILWLSRDIKMWYFQKTIWWPFLQNGSQYLMLLKM